jgi:peptidoglycan/xylan/chitin deacetylase (PgdA/CDA1 family)
VIAHLCFHGIGTCIREREPGESRYWVTEDLFRRVLDEVAGKEQVRLSFDDGNASDLAVALPALTDRGLSATFFALAGRLDDQASLSAADLRELRTAGMSIGSHGWAHVPWRGLDPDLAQRELVTARQVLAEASGGPIDEVALPLGRYDRTLLRRLRTQGYRRVFTSDRLPARANSWLQPRYSITAGDSIDFVRGLLDPRPRPGHLRGHLASLAKRLR